jgi:hypothetical protein
MFDKPNTDHLALQFSPMWLNHFYNGDIRAAYPRGALSWFRSKCSQEMSFAEPDTDNPEEHSYARAAFASRQLSFDILSGVGFGVSSPRVAKGCSVSSALNAGALQVSLNLGIKSYTKQEACLFPGGITTLEKHEIEQRFTKISSPWAQEL